MQSLTPTHQVSRSPGRTAAIALNQHSRKPRLVTRMVGHLLQLKQRKRRVRTPAFLPASNLCCAVPLQMKILIASRLPGVCAFRKFVRVSQACFGGERCASRECTCACDFCHWSGNFAAASTAQNKVAASEIRTCCAQLANLTRHCTRCSQTTAFG